MIILTSTVDRMAGFVEFIAADFGQRPFRVRISALVVSIRLLVLILLCLQWRGDAVLNLSISYS